MPGGHGAQMGRRVGAYHFLGLQCVADTQAYAQAHIRLHRCADLPQRILRAGDQMHAQRTAQRRDTDQAVDVVGQLPVQHVEFVDDDHEPGHRARRVHEVAHTERGGEPLPAVEFAFERTQGARGVFEVEVVDAPAHMGECAQAFHRRAAFEVEEHELQGLRGMGGGEGHAPVLKQHRFARSGGPSHNRMGPWRSKSMVSGSPKGSVPMRAVHPGGWVLHAVRAHMWHIVRNGAASSAMLSRRSSVVPVHARTMSSLMVSQACAGCAPSAPLSKDVGRDCSSVSTIVAAVAQHPEPIIRANSHCWRTSSAASMMHCATNGAMYAHMRNAVVCVR